ncbi:hypothetical protein Pfo_011658 [Paulownia fortunei]|nr:hypothetical protein Pfo_011658 [Paulownia fortunei]
MYCQLSAYHLAPVSKHVLILLSWYVPCMGARIINILRQPSMDYEFKSLANYSEFEKILPKPSLEGRDCTMHWEKNFIQNNLVLNKFRILDKTKMKTEQHSQELFPLVDNTRGVMTEVSYAKKQREKQNSTYDYKKVSHQNS